MSQLASFHVALLAQTLRSVHVGIDQIRVRGNSRYLFRAFDHSNAHSILSQIRSSIANAFVAAVASLLFLPPTMVTSSAVSTAGKLSPQHVSWELVGLAVRGGVGRLAALWHADPLRFLNGFGLSRLTHDNPVLERASVAPLHRPALSGTLSPENHWLNCCHFASKLDGSFCLKVASWRRVFTPAPRNQFPHTSSTFAMH